MSSAMAAMVGTLLTTAPPTTSSPISRRSQWWSPSSHRVSTQSRSSRPAALRISRCSNDATTSTATVGIRVDETRGGDDSSSTSGRCFGEVYVASVPLRAPNGAAQILDAMKDAEIFANFQHYMTIIKPNDDGGDQAPCTVLDFQPQSPEDPMTVVAVLMGNSIPGVILERTLSQLPNQRCWWAGAMKPGLSLEDAVAFSRAYNSELSLGINDCRHHTLDLVEYLTGKSMSFIEEVRTVGEREQKLADELQDELENELEKRSGESSEESQSPDLETVETPVKIIYLTKTCGQLVDGRLCSKYRRGH